METPSIDVSGISSPTVSEDVTTQTQLPEAPVVTSTVAATPGSKTPEANLLAALHEERRLRKEAEDKLASVNTTIPSDEVYSDEGRVLLAKIADLEARDKAREERMELDRLLTQFPVLKEKEAEFLEYRSSEHPRAKMSSVAKLYLSENGLLEPVRKGLESPTGGTRSPMTSELNQEEVKNLRETNYKKYKDLLSKGLIKV